MILKNTTSGITTTVKSNAESLKIIAEYSRILLPIGSLKQHINQHNSEPFKKILVIHLQLFTVFTTHIAVQLKNKAYKNYCALDEMEVRIKAPLQSITNKTQGFF